MRRVATALAVTGLLALGACNRTTAENKADNAREAAENTAETWENKAEEARDAGENRAEAMENKADAARDAGENRADAVEANDSGH
jgi:hypothetical protein